MKWKSRARREPVLPSRHPLLQPRLPPARSTLLRLLLFCGFAVLLARAFWIQVATHDFYAMEGRKRYQATFDLVATRGRIVDRHGRMLATSLPVKAIWATPQDVPSATPAERAKLAELAALLGMAAQELDAKLASASHFVYLKRQVELPLARRIAALGIDGIRQMGEWKRFYPEGEAAAQVTGFTDLDGRGQEGIELSTQALLGGTHGRRAVLRDRLGRVIDDAGLLQAPRDGEDVTLTLDSRIQNAAFNALRSAVETSRAKAGTAVVLHARSGEILALANWPGFDPNTASRARWGAQRLRNRALTDAFEPGSTIKPLNIALALERGTVRPDTQIETAPGWLVMGRHTIRDTSNHGTLSVAGIIQKSSNVGMLKIMLRLPPQTMWEMFQQVGFGRAPDLAFPGPAAGRVRPHGRWRPIEQATMAYGYGLSVSLLQLAQAYTALAGPGKLVPAALVCAAQDSGAASAAVQVFSPGSAQAVRAMLELATQPGGTASGARIPGYRVGAKTGTVRKQADGGYAPGKYQALIVGMAPLSAPQVIVAVMIDEPGGRVKYGGTVAGPAFASIMRDSLRLMRVAPDLPADTEALDGATAASSARRPPVGEPEPA